MVNMKRMYFGVIFVLTFTMLMSSNVFGAPVKCNAKSKKCHVNGCRYYNCKNCTVKFESIKKASKKGDQECKVCR